MIEPWPPWILFLKAQTRLRFEEKNEKVGKHGRASETAGWPERAWRFQ